MIRDATPSLLLKRANRLDKGGDQPQTKAGKESKKNGRDWARVRTGNGISSASPRLTPKGKKEIEKTEISKSQI